MTGEQADREAESKLQHLDDGWGSWMLVTQDRKNEIKEKPNAQKVSPDSTTRILSPLR